MSLRTRTGIFAFLATALLSGPTAAFAAGEVWVAEPQLYQWRSDGQPLLTAPQQAGAIAASPDGGAWSLPYGAATSIVKTAPDGTTALEIPFLPEAGFDQAAASALAVNSADGSAWVLTVQITADFSRFASSLRKLAPDGTQLLAADIAPDAGFSKLFASALAVNPADGSVWVLANESTADFSATAMSLRKFSADGTPQLALGLAPDAGFSQVSASALAVNSADGSLWITQTQFTADFSASAASLRNLASDGTLQRVVPLPASSQYVAVNPSEGTLWVAVGGDVLKFTASGSPLFTVNVTPSYIGVTSLSVDASDGSLWAASAGAGTCSTCPTPTDPAGDTVLKLSTSGAKLFSYTFADNYYNNTRVSVVPGARDAIPPTTSATASPQPNAAGWNNTAVTVALAATDNAGGSGVKSISYTVNNGSTSSGGTLTGASGSFAVSAEGLDTVTYGATDNAGNVEAARTLALRIDRTPPTLTLPAAISANATSPAGASVAYSVGVSDNLDPAPSLTCAPGPGSTFAIGSSSVNCSARDAAGTSATGNFSVTILGAAAQLSNLEALLRGFGLPAGMLRSLDAKLSEALAQLGRGKRGEAACHALNAFLKEVGARSGKQLPASQAGRLTADAVRIRSVLACAQERDDDSEDRD